MEEFNCSSIYSEGQTIGTSATENYPGLDPQPLWDAFWGQRYAILHDPDGNGVDLFAPLG